MTEIEQAFRASCLTAPLVALMVSQNPTGKVDESESKGQIDSGRRELLTI